MESTSVSEIKSVRPSLYYILPIIIILEGFVSISVEILTIRQLLPVAGGNVIVTSLIIGIFLLFLALGYHHGGRRKGDPAKLLRINFLIAAAWLGLGLSYRFVSYFFAAMQQFTGPHIVYPLMSYLLLIIAPLIFILGQTVPISMNMARQDQLAGVIGGRILSLSTIGSFLGAVLTTLLLLHFFGVGWAIFVNFILLILLATVLFDTFKTEWWLIIAWSTIAVVIYYLNIQDEKNLFNHTNNYANYQILNSENTNLRADEKILVINNGLSSYTNAHHKGFAYIEVIKRLLFLDLKLHNKDILVLGAGGFSLSAEYDFDNRFTYIDIDKDIKQLTAGSFKQSPNNHLIIDDARHYIQTTSALYDAIVVDAYTDVKALPSHLITFEFMRSVKSRLKPEGHAVFNVITNPMLSDPYSKRIDNTIRSIFHNCMALPIVYENKATNVIYACINSQQNDLTVYTDNLNRSTTDVFTW